MSALPRTPADVFNFGIFEGLLYKLLIKFFSITGLWKYPIEAQGDFENMKLLDIVYWVYKSIYPLERARRNSGLEEYFKSQNLKAPLLPANFKISNELSLSSVGDLITHPYLINSKKDLYSNEIVKEKIFGADIPMANLECPIFQEAKGELDFNTKKAPSLYYDQENFKCVMQADDRSFLFMSTACNHSLDFGQEGAESTVSILNNNNIAQHGLNLSENEIYQPQIIEKNGIRLGFIAYTFGLNAHQPPTSNPNIVNTMKLNDGIAANSFTKIKKQIENCKNQSVDFIIANLHWGLEFELYPTPKQVELAHFLAELGIDAIIGHHPHVIQPVELYRTKRDSHRVVPVYYSLGNLIFAFTAPWLSKSRIAEITLAKGVSEDGVIKVYPSKLGKFDVIQQANERTKTITLLPCENI